jgi:hypothetical protein
MIRGVRRVRTVVTLLLALLWLPATVHCQLEAISGLEFLSCCQHAAPNTSPTHHAKDCATDGCAAVEAGFYLLPAVSVTPVAPQLAAHLVMAAPAATPSTAELRAHSLPSPVPPDRSVRWRFLWRAAAPPRAPSPIA